MAKVKKTKEESRGPKTLQHRIAENAGHQKKFKAVSGLALCDVDVVRIQVEGDKDSGKSTFLLSILTHLNQVMNLPPEEILICIIDFDKRGIGRLLKKGVISKELMERIVYWKAEDIIDAYDAWEHLDGLLTEHVKKYGSAGAWIAIENTGEWWQNAQDYYSKAVEGMEAHELLIKKKKKAKSKGHEAFSLFENRRDSYKVINPLHNNLRHRITNSDYNVFFSCHLKDVYGNKEDGTEGKVVGKRGEGQKKNEDNVDFVLRCFLDHKTGRHRKELRASKDTETLFKKQFDMDFTGLWKWIYGMMDKEGEKYGRPKIDRYWLKPISKRRK